ncbi:unnamed protein product [Linum tenue]|uniref:Sulfotransferase n=1 Tax=Linum tenue TaxID=586396 RepID=A0AAV0LUM2_9ROSI|nr:unnamed protein product [Linum tenue]
MSIEEMKELAPKKEVMFWNVHEICQMEGFWFLAHLMESMVAFRSDFQPRSEDVLITSFPKTGTTWLMALCHNILHRHDNREEDDILTRMNLHEVVPTLDVFFLTDQVQNLLLNSGGGRLLHTHLPYTCLPESVRNSGCKIVHVTRNPKDTLVSMWHFFNKVLKRDPTATGPFPMEGAVESFCTGVLPWGPFHENVVSYWEESKKRPDEVLFLKYEDMCRDPKKEVRKLASFLGKPFPPTSVNGGVDEEVEKVLWRSSLGRLRELEVNKNNVVSELTQISNSSYFRKGTVGDWKNYLTPQMAERVDQLTQLKLQGTGLSLDDF